MVILAINAAMGAFVFVAHGGALLLVMSGKVPTPPGYEALVRTMAPVTLPIASFVILGSAVALIWARARPFVLSLQSVILFLSGVAILAWALSLILNGIPPGNFVWTPGLITGWVAYASLLLARFALRAWRQRQVVRYMPIIAAGLALPIDAGVFLRFLAKLSHR